MRESYRVTLRLNHGVAPGRLTEPLGAELRCPLLRREVDIDEPEAVAVAVEPFEVVLRAPEEIPVDRYALRRRALELTQVGAQKHHPVRVVHVTVLRHDVRGRAAVFSDEDGVRAP